MASSPVRQKKIEITSKLISKYLLDYLEMNCFFIYYSSAHSLMSVPKINLIKYF